MGCGFGIYRNRVGKSQLIQGKISKKDFVTKKLISFTSEYSFEKYLGAGKIMLFTIGTYGEVWQVSVKSTGQLRAVKIIKKNLMAKNSDLCDFVNSEIITLAKIVKFVNKNRIVQM